MERHLSDTQGPWARALFRLLRNRLALCCLLALAAYLVVALLSASGVMAGHFSESIGPAYHPPGGGYFLGTDILGRSVAARLAQGAWISLLVGFGSTAIAVPIGVALGLLAGGFHRRIDALVVWFYTTLDAIPTILLLLSLALVLPTGKGVVTVCLALGVTAWVSTCRIVRGEVMRQREMNYVRAARALGVGPLRILFHHILPNLTHLVLVQASLIFVAAVKSEVILSYLGVGIQGRPSWGIMIDDSRLELVGRGAWWQFSAATMALFGLVLAFNLLADALKEALDTH